MFQTAVKILKATIGIQSNAQKMLPPTPMGVKLESLLTDFRRVEQILFRNDLDGNISVENTEGSPMYHQDGNRVMFKGPFLQLQIESSDPRYTLWGNQGFLYRFTLYLLEKKHNIYNLHACALYREDRDILYLIIGGAGSGKTVYLLSGLEKGLKLFSTETVHFRVNQGGIAWYMGSLVDNVRYGTLVHDFPGFLPEEDVPDFQSEWQEKFAIDLSAFCTQKEILENPQAVHILFPRIEKGFERSEWTPVKDKRKAEKILFDNITQKIGETTLLYDRLPVLGLDRKDLADARLQAVKGLAGHQTIAEIASVVSSPQDCWGSVLK
jgi:hypothetical protein